MKEILKMRNFRGEKPPSELIWRIYERRVLLCVSSYQDKRAVSLRETEGVVDASERE